MDDNRKCDTKDSDLLLTCSSGLDKKQCSNGTTSKIPRQTLNLEHIKNNSREILMLTQKQADLIQRCYLLTYKLNQSCQGFFATQLSLANYWEQPCGSAIR